MSVGTITKYTVFTSGATLPTNFIVSSSLTTKTDYLSQGSYAGTFSGTLTGSSTSMLDSNDKKTITLAYSKPGMNYADYNWLAAWNGYELRAINKNQFATASHTHNYLPLTGGTVSGIIKTSNNTAADIGFTAVNSETGKSVSLMVGSSKTSRGVYDNTAAKWMIYSDVNNNVYVNGNASTASKLATARTISFGGDLSGSVSFDGSANVTATVYDRNVYATLGNTNNYPYHRIAKLDTITGAYVDKSITLYLSQNFQDGSFGIVRITLRTNSSSSASGVEAKWLVRSGFSAGDVQVGIYNVYGKTYADVFLKINAAYSCVCVRQIAAGERGTTKNTWTLVGSAENNNTTATDNKSSTECWQTVALAAAALHKQDYSTIVSAIDTGNVSYANSAGAVTWGNVTGKPSTFTPASHTHTKSQITDFPTSMPASDVSAWAKASTKPTYTWSEITNKPSTYYTHPSYTAKTSGLYKITVDATGHVSATTAVAKADITALGIPGSNTDTKVTQTAIDPSTYTNWRTVVWGASSGATEGFSPATVTDQVYSSKNLSFQPSTGTLKATIFKGDLSGNAITASKLATARTISFTGSVTGSGTFDGSGNLSITTTTNHTHSQYYDSDVTRSANTVLAAPNGSDGKASFRKLVVADLPSHTHNYAGSSSAGGSATSAVKLDVSTAGSATQPVYFSGGKPVACTYTLGKSVPSDAKFTDTNTWIALKGATTSADGTAGYAPAPTKGNPNRYLRSDGTWAVPPDTNTVYTHPTSPGNRHIPAGGSSGQILRWSADGTAVWGSDNNTTYSVFKGATSNAAGSSGLVPAPATGNAGKYLRGDGTWATPTNTVYTHPNSGVTAGTYRSVTVNAAGHVTAGTNPTTLSGYGITDAAPKSHTHAWSDITNYSFPTFSGITMDQYGAYIYNENDGNIKFRYTGTDKDTSTYQYINMRTISTYVNKIAAHNGQYVMSSDGLHALTFASTAANGTATVTTTISNWNSNWYYTYYTVYSSQYFNITGVSLSNGKLTVSGANISNGTHTGSVGIRVLAFSAI